MDVQKPPPIFSRKFAAPGTLMVRPLLLKPQWMNGLSGRLLVRDYENNYGGALRWLNAIRARLADFDWVRSPTITINGLRREELMAASSVMPLLTWAPASHRREEIQFRTGASATSD